MDGSSQTVGDICNLNTFSFQGWSWKENKFNFFFFNHGRAHFYSQSFSEFSAAELRKTTVSGGRSTEHRD